MIHVAENVSGVQPEYPCLKKGSTGVVVLFTEPNKGLVLKSGSTTYKVGNYSDDWNEHSFTLYPNIILISNI